MAKMLDGPVPDGARSVSWPWYHHVLGDELTTDARGVLEKYSKIPPRDVESHIYRIVNHLSSEPTVNIKLTSKYVERQSMGNLPLALHRRILVPQLRSSKASTL